MIQDILHLLVSTVTDIYTLLVVLRFLLQVAKADFYNPLSQFIVKATDPLLKPLRRFIPGFWGIDLSSLVLALLVQIAGVVIVSLLAGSLVTNPFIYLLVGVFGVLEAALNFYFFAIIILIIISWIAPQTYNPAAALLSQLTDPVLTPFRRLLPSMGGLDFSPMLALFVIHILRAIILPGLIASLGSFL
jgi:YggT family protein